MRKYDFEDDDRFFDEVDYVAAFIMGGLVIAGILLLLTLI